VQYGRYVSGLMHGDLGTSASTGRPVLEDVRDLLFVVDTVHTQQGASGQVWLDDISYVK